MSAVAVEAGSGARSTVAGVTGGCETPDLATGAEPWYSGRVVSVFKHGVVACSFSYGVDRGLSPSFHR